MRTRARWMAALWVCLGWPVGASAQLSVQVTSSEGTSLEVLPSDVPSSTILPPAWVYWRRPDGTTSMPCGELPAFPALCETPNQGDPAGLHRLEIVESIGNQSHVYEVETDGTESSVRFSLSGGVGTVHLTRRAPGLVLVPGPVPESLLLMNRSDAPRRVTTVNHSVVAGVTRFSMVLGWRGLHSTDLHGTFGEVTIPPGRGVSVSFDRRVASLRPGLYNARVVGRGSHSPGRILEVHTTWISEDYVFYGTAP